MCVYVCMHACIMCVRAYRCLGAQVVSEDSLGKLVLLSSKSSDQAWWQASVPIELSCQPPKEVLLTRTLSPESLKNMYTVKR